jgi:hypothetical protein
VIDFRYHLVSIIAIFLALAVGLVVGATTLTGPTETALNKAEHALSQANAGLRTRNTALNQQLGADQAFAQAGSARLLTGLLTGQKVVLVIPPGTDGTLISDITSSLQQAGARVTGKVNLQPSFFDFSAPTETNLSGLATSLATQAGVKLDPAANQAVAGQQAAAQVIAASIVAKDLVTGGLPAATSKAIQSQFGGYLQISPTGASLGTANLAVVFTPSSAGNSTAQDTVMSQALSAVANELAAASHGTVLAGSVGAITPNTPSAILTEGSSGPASTVDNADTPSGSIMVAQALAQLLQNKAPGAYGVEPGTAPSPAPTPSATPTPGTSTSVSKGKSK